MSNACLPFSTFSGTTPATLRIVGFGASEPLDTLLAVNSRWQREIALIKDREPLGPNYYIIRDELAAGTSGTWRLYLSGERVEQDGNRVRVVGREDVDTDIVFLTGKPADLSIETVTRISNSSFLNRPVPTTQMALVAPMPPGGATIAVLLYPRIKKTPSPTVQAEMEGRVVHVDTAAGVHTVFVAREPFEYVGEKVHFKGTVGAFIQRNDADVLALGALGELSALGRELRTETATSRSWPR